MKLWSCSYYQSWGYGAYEDIECIINAETKEVALGLALEKYKETDTKYWFVEELVLEDYEVYEISKESD